MIRHAVKLLWNRKRQNALVLLEIVGSFLVLIALLVSLLGAWSSWRRPIGFEVRDVWRVRCQAETAADASSSSFGSVFLDTARGQQAVVEAGLLLMSPYTTSGMRAQWTTDDGSTVATEIVGASPSVREVLGLEIHGRWFSEADRADTHTPIVVNRAFADAVYGAGFVPDGQIFTPGERDSYRIVGLLDYFRKGGELSAETPMFFQPMWPDEPLRHGMATLVLRMQPGAPGRAEQTLVEALQAAAPAWSFDIARLEDMRAEHLRRGLAPLVAGGTVAAFLLLMVGLGLTGVLWQDVSRRTREIGLRRAQGATARDVRRQIALELILLTLFGVVIGGLIAAQLPLLGLLGAAVDPARLMLAFALAALALLALTLVCGLYPSWLATRIQPARALHHS